MTKEATDYMKLADRAARGKTVGAARDTKLALVQSI